MVPFVAFCAISGKQIHYLLPLLPAWMLAGAWLLQQAGARLKPRLFALLALLAGVGIAWLPWQAARVFHYPPPRAVALLALVALVLAVGLWRAWGRSARGIALSAAALLATALLAGTLAYQPALDVRPAAAFVAQALRADTPIAYVEQPGGLFGYAGRLRRPLPWITPAAVSAWCRAHPDGVLVTGDRHDEPAHAAPYESWPYILSGSRRIAVWRAADVLRAQH